MREEVRRAQVAGNGRGEFYLAIESSQLILVPADYEPRRRDQALIGESQ